MQTITLKLFAPILLTVIILQSCRINYLYPKGKVLSKIDQQKYKDLQNDLSSGNLIKVKNDFFGTVNDCSLPDVICYISKNDTAIIGMPRASKDQDYPTLWDKKKMWVIIFSKNPMVVSDTNKDIVKRIKNYYGIYCHDTTVAFYDSNGHHPDANHKVHAKVTHYRISQITDSLSPSNPYLRMPNSTLSTNMHTIVTDTITAISASQMAKSTISQPTNRPTPPINSSNNNTNVSVTASIGAPNGQTTTVRANSSAPQSGNSTSLATPKIVMTWDSSKIKRKRPNDSLSIKRSVLEYSPPPGLASFDGLIKAFASLFTKATNLPGAYSGTTLNDTTINAARGKITVIKNPDNKSDSIIEYMVGIPIVLNSVNRIVITPPGNNSTNFIDYNFGNYESTRISAGVGLGVNFNPDNPFNDLGFKGLSKITSQQVDQADFAKLYMFVGYYILRPQLPEHMRSIALVVGTNISGNIFNDFLTGVGFYHGNGGLIVATNYLMYNSVRRLDLTVGLEYKF